MQKKNKITTPYAVIITRKNPHLNFGQTVTIIGYNKNDTELVVMPDGENVKYKINYTECWIADSECDHQAREKQLTANGIWD